MNDSLWGKNENLKLVGKDMRRLVLIHFMVVVVVTAAVAVAVAL
jgi:hypothetical protein